MHATTAPPWALILAGGDGSRLRPPTRRIAGDHRPEPFCDQSLLERTRRRVDRGARAWGRPERVLATARRTGWRPAWLSQVRRAPAG